MEGAKALSVAGLLLIWLARMVNCQDISCTSLENLNCSDLDEYEVEDDFEDVNIRCFTGKDPLDPETYRTAPFRQFSDLVNDGQFDKSKCLMLVVADWDTEDTATKIVNIMTGFLRPNTVNVCQLLWSSVTVGKPYEESVALSTYLAPLLTEAMDQGRDAGVPCFHMTGHGLAAHLLGATCRDMETKCERMIALDPSGPFYTVGPNCVQPLSGTDAVCVRVYHTDAGFLGTANSSGTVDLWVNGGSRPQPGCSDPTVAELCSEDATPDSDCSHSRAQDIAVEAIINRQSILGVLCPSWEAFEAGECIDNPTASLDACEEDTIHGSYYFITGDSPPYGLGVNGTRP